MNVTTFTIEAVERRTKRGLAPSLVFGFAGTADRDGWFASVTLDSGERLDLSRLDDESGWAIDGLFTRTGLPVFFNGFGCRAVAVTRPDADLADALTDEAAYAEMGAEQTEAEAR